MITDSPEDPISTVRPDEVCSLDRRARQTLVLNRDPSSTMLRHLLLITLAVMPLLSHAIEEPDYEVIRKLDNVELRRYAPYVVAEVVLNATAEEAGSQAFPILAGYIFGKNKGERKFAMTAPVTQTAAPVKMEMTAPVTQVS